MEKGRSPGQGKRAGLPLRDDLPAVSTPPLRKSGAITLDTTSILITFGELKREVKVAHMLFPARGTQGKRGSWSLFVCPSCSRRAKTLRLYDGRVTCARCDGLIYACQAQDKGPRIERLRALLSRKIRDKRARLETHLRRALIVERRKRLG
jgi:hypothetical protein